MFTNQSKIAVISPHLDDGIFSLGDFMQGKDATVITPFGGYPEDPEGYKKYEILHREHIVSCEILGVKIINGDFLDDVYPGLDPLALRDWLEEVVKGFDYVLIPLGIRHYDHIAVRKAFDTIDINNKLYYSDLPYATDYPEDLDKLTENLVNYSQKEAAVKNYASQAGGTVPERVLQREQIWK